MKKGSTLVPGDALTRLVSLRRVLVVDLFCLLLVLPLAGFVAPAQAQCVAPPISPNPNPVGNTITITAGSSVCNPTVFLNEGTLDNSGQFEHWGLTNSGTLNNNFGGNFRNGFEGIETTNLYGGTVNNKGVFWSDWNNRGTWNNSGSMYAGTSSTNYNTGVFNNNAGGTLDQGADGLINIGVFNNNLGGTVSVGPFELRNDVGGTFNNYGTFNHNGALNNNGTFNNGGTLISTGLEWINNSGQFWVSATGIVTSAGSYTQTSGITTIDGSMTQGAVNINGGLLQGSGSIIAPVTINGGTISAGHSPGTLSIGGDLTFNSGLLLTEIGGTGTGQFDLLKVAGKASILGGTLGFSFADFIPHVGDTWTFLTAEGGIDLGTFNTTFSFADPDLGRQFLMGLSLDSSGKEMNLIVSAIPEPETYAQLLTGIVVMGFIMRRQRRKEKARP